MELYNEDCLERLKKIPDKSIDLIFNDLPYGQTSCKWDSLIDIDELWKEYKRIRKDTTPIFFTCTTKFGHSLISSNMKEFRYDLVWVKSASCGFLNAKKMPMKKHEMIYVFYKKLPLYDLSSHTHKFLKEGKKTNNDIGNECYGKFTYYNNGEKGYDPPLPVSVIKYDCKYDSDLYGKKTEFKSDSLYGYEDKKIRYKNNEGKITAETNGKRYDPPLPVSVIRTDEGCNGLYGNEKGKKIMFIDKDGKQRNTEPRYDPPLPVSVIKEYTEDIKKGTIDGNEIYKGKKVLYRNKSGLYEPPLPNSILEIKSQKGKHSTQKPDALMEWILKYYSKENDIVLDPTMGSGSMGVACKKMNRKFIGIEKDEEIFKVAEERIN